MFALFGRKKRTTKLAVDGQRKLYIPELLYRKMVNHCREERPLEACGLLTGVGDQVVAAYATDNEYRSPVLYKVDDRQLLKVVGEAHNQKQEIVAIYHSHIRSAPIPSQTDIKQATWPEAFYLIVSLAHRMPQVRAWRIVDQQVTEHPVVIQRGTSGDWHDLRQAVQATEQLRQRDIPTREAT